MNTKLLSYPLKQVNPVYGDPGAKLEIRQTKSTRDGSSSNTFMFTVDNHTGTHVDCPAHFFDNGMKVIDFAPEFWFFKKPCLITKDAKECEIFGPDVFEAVPEDADIVLLRTGFSKYRGEDKYSLRNPGIAPEAGEWLRKNRPTVRALGLDSVSLSSYANRTLGRQAHKSFLDNKGVNHPIVLIEDMDLGGNLDGLASIWVSPIIVESLDSAPCTVFGIFQE